MVQFNKTNQYSDKNENIKSNESNRKWYWCYFPTMNIYNT